MKLSPGQRIQWQDWRDKQWHNAKYYIYYESLEFWLLRFSRNKF